MPVRTVLCRAAFWIELRKIQHRTNGWCMVFASFKLERGDTTMLNYKIAKLLSCILSAGTALLTSMLVCGSGGASAQSPLPIPAVMPNVVVTTASPVAFQQLTVRADFSTAYCISSAYPLYSNVSLSGGVLSVVLSHLRAGPCVTTRTLSLPGLPAGTYGLRISITADDTGAIQRQRTYEAEVGQTTFLVAQPPGIRLGVLCMARVDLPAYGPYGSGPVMLSGCFGEDPLFSTPRTNGITPLEIGTATPSFAVYSAPAGTPLTAPFTQLYAVTYPLPLAGAFWTTSLADCTAFNLALNGKPACDISTTIVLQAKSGVCPLGTSPVYRVFQPQAIAHRYTQSAATYAALVEANHVAEGIAWFALAPS